MTPATSTMSALVNLDDIRDAQARLRRITVHTKLTRSQIHAADHPDDFRELYLKPETPQPIGAFKLRGAYNKIASLSADERNRGVITYSSGNHAQGVAY